MESHNAAEDERLFERTMKSLEAQISSAGAHLTIDTRARSLYTQEIKNMSEKLRADAIARRITWAAARVRRRKPEISSWVSSGRAARLLGVLSPNT